MRRASVVPFLILSLLVVLAAGAAVLGYSQAPASGDLAVHNGAGETLAASSLTAVYTSTSSNEVVRIRFRAPDSVTETLVKGGPAGSRLRVATATGARALAALDPVRRLLDVTGFTAQGPSYVGVESIGSLVPASEAHLVSGSIRYSATVTAGYVVDVVEHDVVVTPGGTETGGGRYRIVRIGSWKVPAA